jgi:DNA repair protein RecO
MKEVKTQGLLLQTLPYLETHRILKVLTPEGLVSLMAKSAASPKAGWQSLTTPFLMAEWVYEVGHRDLASLKDGTILEEFPAIKRSFDALSCAGQIAQALLQTQLPGKRAEMPLALGVASLRKMSLFQNPKILLAAFRLRLLAYEGLLTDSCLTTLSFGIELLSLKKFSELACLSIDEGAEKAVERLFQLRCRL